MTNENNIARLTINKAITLIQDHGRLGSVQTWKRKGDFWKSKEFANLEVIDIKCDVNPNNVIKRLSDAGFQQIEVDKSWGFEWDTRIVASNRKF